MPHLKRLQLCLQSEELSSESCYPYAGAKERRESSSEPRAIPKATAVSSVPDPPDDSVPVGTSLNLPEATTADELTEERVPDNGASAAEPLPDQEATEASQPQGEAAELDTREAPGNLEVVEEAPPPQQVCVCQN